MKMTSVLIAVGLGLAFTGSVNAACYGSGSYQDCYDDNGNSYTVNRYGNSTELNGYNAQTGSTWNQHSETIGNTTYHTGTASNGNSWNMTQEKIGNETFISGTDSEGNSFTKTCDKYGCY